MAKLDTGEEKKERETMTDRRTTDNIATKTDRKRRREEKKSRGRGTVASSPG